MWPNSLFTENLALEIPILQAPMAGVTTTELAAAVSRAGALGGLGCGSLDPKGLGPLIQQAREAGATPLNVNFFLHTEPTRNEPQEAAATEAIKGLATELGVQSASPPSVPYRSFGDETLEVLVKTRPEVVTFHFAPPSASVVKALHDANILIGATATTVREAQALDNADCDFVIAQGGEAGGHRGTFAPPYNRAVIGTLALVPQVVDAVSVPVVAAGGICDGRGVAAALVLGASAVQVGTAFLRCSEAKVHPVQRRLLGEKQAEDTCITEAFSGRPARAFHNRLVDLVEASGKQAEYPVQFTVTAPLRSASADAGLPDAQSMWAGQGFPLSRETSAEDLVYQLAEETRVALRPFS